MIQIRSRTDKARHRFPAWIENLRRTRIVLIDLEIRGTAALSICESLLLCLTDLKILSEVEVEKVMRDAAEAHIKAESESDNPELHKAVSDMINAIIEGGNSVRRS
jgi:hypothetical protein